MQGCWVLYVVKSTELGVIASFNSDIIWFSFVSPGFNSPFERNHGTNTA